MKKPVKPKLASIKSFYVGTTAELAKLAPVKGLTNSPLILTTAYPGFFAAAQGKNWGIIEVDARYIFEDCLAPFHGYVEKLYRKKTVRDNFTIQQRRQECLANIKSYRKTWRESIESCGVCLYLGSILPDAIERVTVYSSTSNPYITAEATKIDPWELSQEAHKAALKRSSLCTKWLSCNPFELKDWLPSGIGVQEANKVTNLINDRNGLNIFHIRSEKELKGWWIYNDKKTAV